MNLNEKGLVEDREFISLEGRITRRGFDIQDEKWFSRDMILKLQTAQQELQWLLDRGYKIDSIVNFIGGHYQFSARQRNALKRATSSKVSCEKRKEKLLSNTDAKEDCLYIDGFNLIITLEVALSKSILLLSNDGTLRDIAGLRGTYSIIDKTDKALKLVGKELKKLQVPQVKFFLDTPVSNSGRLKNRILNHSEEWNIPAEVELVANPDKILSDMERIVTSDSVILDKCISWFNLSRKVVQDYIDEAIIIDLSSEKE